MSSPPARNSSAQSTGDSPPHPANTAKPTQTPNHESPPRPSLSPPTPPQNSSLPLKMSPSPCTAPTADDPLSSLKQSPLPSKRKRSRVDESDWASSGGYMASKNAKLRSQFAQEFAGAATILCGVTVWVNGATTPSREEVRVAVGAAGGAFETYFGPAVTHVVCERLSTATRTRLKKAVTGRSLKIVTPVWVVDCVKEGRKVAEAGYAVDRVVEKRQTGISAFFGSGSKQAREGKQM